MAWTWNGTRDTKYERAVFDALVARYEEPEARNRWDAPLFVVWPEQRTVDLAPAIAESLFERNAPPPNQSTQNVRGFIIIIYCLRRR